MNRRARLLLLPPLVSAALVGPAALPSFADDTGHDHSTMDMDMDMDTPAVDTSTGHQHATAPKDRPLGLVLGTFGGVNGAVVLGAALVRRRERAARQEKQTRRSQRRATPAEVAE